MIGVLIAAYDADEVLAKPVSGAFAGRFGMKQTMLIRTRHLCPGVRGRISWLTLASSSSFVSCSDWSCGVVGGLRRPRGGIFRGSSRQSLRHSFTTGWLLFVVAILAGVGVGTVWTNTDALISLKARAGQLGATMGAAGTFTEIGDILGPLLVGAVSQAFGLTIGFATCGFLGPLSLAVSRVTRPGGVRGPEG